MAFEIDGQIFYQTSEACKKTGISRATLFRWLKVGVLDKYYKDHRGWRLFTEEDLNKIRAEARKIQIADSYYGDKNGQNSNK